MLATVTAKWETLDARSEIHHFTDSLNEIGTGYNFGKDFVLKACLYLSEGLPIQYQVKNFTRKNLRNALMSFRASVLMMPTTKVSASACAICSRAGNA